MTTLPKTNDLVLEQDGSVLTIWFNRVEAKNSLSGEMVAELDAVLDAVRDDRGIRTLIIRGKGGIFCAGGDIKGFKAGSQGGQQSEDDVAAGNREFGDVMIKLNEQPQAVIMLVEGAAIGGEAPGGVGFSPFSAIESGPFGPPEVDGPKLAAQAVDSHRRIPPCPDRKRGRWPFVTTTFAWSAWWPYCCAPI